MRIEKDGVAPANNVAQLQLLLEVLVKAGLLPPLGGVPKQSKIMVDFLKTHLFKPKAITN